MTRIDGAGRQHTDRMNIMAEVYGQKNDELTSEERWEKLVAEAEEKFEGRGL